MNYSHLYLILFSLISFQLLFYSQMVEYTAQNCSFGCSICNNQSRSHCLACQNVYESSKSGDCVPNTYIKNCILYDYRFNCLKCRPSFRLENNRCFKMYDGCLQSRQLSLCEKCYNGAILDKVTSTCQLNQLNCQELGRHRKCIKCKANYAYNKEKGICLYKGKDCLKVDNLTGLCAQCQKEYELLGYDCWLKEKTAKLENCYLAFQNSENTTKASSSSSQLNPTLYCKYCKSGYTLFNGQCLVQATLAFSALMGNCSIGKEYLQGKKCIPIPQNCIQFDYGLKTCLYCQGNQIYFKGQCRKDIQKNCLRFDIVRPQVCQECKPLYYLNQDSQCISFPAFCQQFSGKCLRCIDTFLLNSNSFCIDPNCNQSNLFSGQCVTCKVNYQKDFNQENICRYVDPNCAKRNVDDYFQCQKCKESYEISTSGFNKVCKFVDANCLKQSAQQGVCSQCKQNYYYNNNVMRCMLLPDHCVQADGFGRCTQCALRFALVTTYQCLAINPLPNCRILNQTKPSVCQQCIQRYFPNAQGVCEKLPFFCKEYDSVANKCKFCTQGGKPNGFGMCIDRNCQYFHPQRPFQCLGCYEGYEFGPFGQCNIERKDPNCKSFQFKQCKQCSDRYYFDKNWKCIPVSTLCREYDQNSGLCTRCYSGYALSGKYQGECVLNLASQGSEPGDNDVIMTSFLDEYCIVKSKINTQSCEKCVKGYDLVSLVNQNQTQNIPVIQCLKSNPKPSNDFCSDYDSDNSQLCTQCVPRMYLNEQGICQAVDQNCQQFDELTGECFKCYYGYTIKNVKIVIEEDSTSISNQAKIRCFPQIQKDQNCKTVKQVGIGCEQCYQGLYYSELTKKCQYLNDLCQTHDLVTGSCLTCFPGYTIVNSLCIISQFIDKDPGQSQDQYIQKNCLTFQEQDPFKCQKCIWGYLPVNGRCLQKDTNCKTFLNDVSLVCNECYSGFKIVKQDFQYDATICVEQSQLALNCLEYASDFKCSKCRSNYMRKQLQNGQIECQLKDQLCLQYDEINPSNCVKCIQASMIVENGKCMYPLYGFDPNCSTYSERICKDCVSGYKIQGFICVEV